MTPTAQKDKAISLGGTVRCDIFLSHNRKDREFVRQVAEGLELEFGIPHFLDEYAIPVGEKFVPWLEEALGRSKGCAIFLGLNGWGPTHLWEAEKALARYRLDPEYRLIPVVLDTIAESDGHRLGGGAVFQEINWVRFDGKTVDAEQVEKLAAAFRGDRTSSSQGPAVLTPYVLRRISALWAKSHDTSLLYRGAQLRRAEQLAIQSGEMVGGSAAAFLAASNAAATARTRNFAVISGVVAIALLALSFFLYEANQNGKSRELAALALSADQRDRGLLQAIAAHEVRPTSEARSALFRLLGEVPYVQFYLHGAAQNVRTVAASAERQFAAAAGSGGTIAVWDLKNPRRNPWILQGPTNSPAPGKGAPNRVDAIEFALNGKAVAAGYEHGGFGIWDLSGQRFRPVAGWPAPSAGTPNVFVDQFGPDPEPPETQGERPVRALAVAQEKNLAFVGDQVGRLYCVQLLTAQVQWQARPARFALELVKVLPHHGIVLAADGGGSMFAHSFDGKRTYEVATNVHSARLLLAHELEKGLITLDTAGSLVTWRFTHDQFVVEKKIELPVFPVAGAYQSSSDQLFVATRSGTIRRFSRDGRELNAVEGHRLAALSIAWAEGASWCVSGGIGGEVLIWDVDRVHPLVTGAEHDNEFIISLRRRLHQLEVITQEMPEIHWRPVGEPSSTNATLPVLENFSEVAFLEGSQSVAVAYSDSTIRYFAQGTLDRSSTYAITNENALRLSPIAISPTHLVAVDNSPRAWIWDFKRPGTPVFQGHLPDQVSSLAFSPDGQFLFAGGLTGKLMRWSLSRAGCPLQAVEGARGPIFALAMHPEKRQILTGSGASDRLIRFWDLDTLELQKSLPERHRGSISRLVWSPDARTLVSTDDEGVANLWDTRTWRLQGTLRHPIDTIFQDVAFEMDSRSLVTANTDTLWHWHFSDADLVREARVLANRDMDPHEKGGGVDGE